MNTLHCPLRRLKVEYHLADYKVCSSGLTTVSIIFSISAGCVLIIYSAENCIRKPSIVLAFFVFIMAIMVLDGLYSPRRASSARFRFGQATSEANRVRLKYQKSLG